MAQSKSSDGMVGGDHYKVLPIPPYEYCQKNQLNCLESNIVKYVTRHEQKGGLDDLNKAKHCLDLLIEWKYGIRQGKIVKVKDGCTYRGVPNPRR